MECDSLVKVGVLKIGILWVAFVWSPSYLPNLAGNIFVDIINAEKEQGCLDSQG